MHHPNIYVRSFILAAAVALSPIAVASTYEEIQVLSQGMQPTGNLASRGDGYFYGVSRSSEANPNGMIYRHAPGQEAEVLFTFDDVDFNSSTNVGGTNPNSPLTAGPNGEFYGTTSYGGAHGMGTIYRLSPDGIFSVLRDIQPMDGYDCWRLVLTPTGDLLGTMADGGPQGAGTIFRLSPDGTYQTVHAFQSPTVYPPGTPVPPGARFEPFYPNNLAIAPDGEIYGTTSGGGPIEAFGSFRFSYGTFFHLEDTGDITVLGEFHQFRKRPESLAPTTDGFFSTTEGAMFHISFNGAISVEADFTAPEFGGSSTIWTPVATSHGIYGVSMYGGTNGGGFIYRTLPQGGTSIIHNFPTNFERCQPALAEGTDGLIYGLVDFGATDPSILPRIFRLHESATSPNFVPVATPDEAWLPKKAKNGKREIIIDILANDQDADSDPLTIAQLSGQGAGSAELIETPQGPKLKFSTQEAEPASRVIAYQLSDSQGGVSTGYVAIQSPVKDKFSGLASGGSVANAPLEVKIDKDNEIKATFELNGKKYKGSSRLDASDTANVALTATGQTSLNLHLELQRGTAASLKATIRNGEADYHATCTASGGN